MPDAAVSEKIPDDVLSTKLQGANLRGTTLGENLLGPPTLVVFLRHFG